jgi:hypothetical protein
MWRVWFGQSLWICAALEDVVHSVVRYWAAGGIPRRRAISIIAVKSPLAPKALTLKVETLIFQVASTLSDPSRRGRGPARAANTPFGELIVATDNEIAIRDLGRAPSTSPLAWEGREMRFFQGRKNL